MKLITWRTLSYGWNWSHEQFCHTDEIETIFFRHTNTLTFMDELWPYMDEITYWVKHIFVIEGSFIWKRQPWLNGVELMDDDMMDEGDHHPYNLNFMLDSICLLKFITIKLKSMCLINFIHVKLVPIHHFHPYGLKSKHHPCGRS